jgi:hypothetical protein
MTGLTVRVMASRPDRYAATPTLLLRLRLDTSEDEPVHAMVLKAQIRIEPQRRRYPRGSAPATASKRWDSAWSGFAI